MFHLWEELRCFLALILHISATLLEGWITILPKYTPSFRVFKTVVESAV